MPKVNQVVYTRMHEKGVAITAALLIYYMLRWLALKCAQQRYRALLIVAAAVLWKFVN